MAFTLEEAKEALQEFDIQQTDEVIKTWLNLLQAAMITKKVLNNSKDLAKLGLNIPMGALEAFQGYLSPQPQAKKQRLEDYSSTTGQHTTEDKDKEDMDGGAGKSVAEEGKPGVYIRPPNTKDNAIAMVQILEIAGDPANYKDSTGIIKTASAIVHELRWRDTETTLPAPIAAMLLNQDLLPDPNDLLNLRKALEDATHFLPKWSAVCCSYQLPGGEDPVLREIVHKALEISVRKLGLVLLVACCRLELRAKESQRPPPTMREAEEEWSNPGTGPWRRKDAKTRHTQQEVKPRQHIPR